MAGKSKVAVQTAAETKEMESTQAAGQTVEETKNPTVTNEETGRLMYVGPTVPGIGIQNRVYTEIPADAKEVIKKEPQIGNLFIRIRDYPAANRMLREKKGYIHNAFLRAEEIMAEGVESITHNNSEETEERG